MNTIIPPFLKKGDCIGLISTARKISEQELKPAIDIIQSYGFDVVLGKNLFEEDHQLAGSPHQRAESLSSMILMPNVKAIFCVRGGYGTIQMVDLVDYNLLIQNPKWIVGFSDVTVLHAKLQKLKICSIHGIMPILFSKEEAKNSVENLFQTLKGEVKSIIAPFHKYNRQGVAVGKLVGGNLSLINNIIGTNLDVFEEKTILFFEDLDEYLYHIDRMMWHLLKSGKLENVSGVIVGHLTEMKDNTIPFGKDAEQIVFDHLKNFDVPFCFGFPAGHSYDNFSLFMGSEIKLSVTLNESTVYFKEIFS